MTKFIFATAAIAISFTSNAATADEFYKPGSEVVITDTEYACQGYYELNHFGERGVGSSKCIILKKGSKVKIVNDDEYIPTVNTKIRLLISCITTPFLVKNTFTPEKKLHSIAFLAMAI